jgi:hypothetical protein
MLPKTDTPDKPEFRYNTLAERYDFHIAVIQKKRVEMGAPLISSERIEMMRSLFMLGCDVMFDMMTTEFVLLSNHGAELALTLAKAELVTYFQDAHGKALAKQKVKNEPATG